MAITQKIVPNLWFEDQAEEAARYYVSIFKDASIGRITKYGKEGYDIHKQPEGKVMTVEFEIEGQKYLGLNGGPDFKFNESISFIVYCETQEEIDYYWNKLNQGGDPNAQQCGWLKDKFGLSWQIVPIQLDDWMASSDKEKAGRTMNAMLQMKKLDLSTLERAYNGEEYANA